MEKLNFKITISIDLWHEEDFENKKGWEHFKQRALENPTDALREGLEGTDLEDYIDEIKIKLISP